MAGQQRIVVTHDFHRLALRFRNRANLVRPKIMEVERQVMEFAKQQAIDASSYEAYVLGDYPRDETGPYSVVNPHPPIPAQYANKQSGEMSRSWKTQVQPTTDGATSTLYNTQSYSRFFNGRDTVLMIGRPLLQKILRRVRDVRNKLMAKAIQEALEEGGQ